MAFDPDKYLASKETIGQFDPDVYLAARQEQPEAQPEEVLTAAQRFGRGLMGGIVGGAQATQEVGGQLLAGGAKGASQIGATLLRPFETAEESVARREAVTSGLAGIGAKPESLLFKTGKIGTEIAGTAGLGGVLAKGLTKVAPRLTSLAEAMRTGGFRAAGAGLPTRIAGGAITGGAMAGMVRPEEAGIGAVIGGALPTVLRPIAAAGGLIREAFTGRTVLPEAQAQSANLAELARIQTLKELPVPITEQDVIRSQITRQYPQQEAERLVAGQPVIGTELAQRLQRGQEKMLENIDVLAKRTGAKAPSPEVAGETVRTWAQNIYGAAKKDTQAAYEYAKKLHGDKQFYPSDELVNSLVENRAMPGYQELFNQAKNMGVIVPKKGGDFTGGRVTVNVLDKFKSIATRTSQSADGNVKYAGGDITNKIYNQLDEIAPEFREAAKIRRRQGQMFEQPIVTQKILGTTTGRLGKAEETVGGITIPEYKVASEKLINTIVNSSNQELRYVRNLALTGTREQKQQGIQAIREMRGSVVNGLRDVWERTQTPQAKANQVEKYFNKLGDEKIETLFGKAGAREIRKFRDAADIVNRAVPAPEGGSQTVGRLMIMGGKLIDLLEKIPVAGAGAVQVAKFAKGAGTAAAAKQIPKPIKPKGRLAELAMSPEAQQLYYRGAPIIGAQ